MLLCGSCSEEMTDNMGNGNGVTENAGAGMVRFALGGSAGGGVQTRASDPQQQQTAEERKVHSLLAVVFTDKSGDIETGTNKTEDAADPYCKTVEVQVVEDESGTGEQSYQFEIGEVGHYHICFVANPNETLKGKIEALTSGTSTVADFKALEADQAPDDKTGGLLMTSEFYGAYATNTKNTDLGTVELTRAMSRIDIINTAKGITVTQAVLKKRTVKTKLISDSPALVPTYLEGTDKTYGSLNLVGDPDKKTGAVGDPNAYVANIYSYEQYGTSEAEQAPTMDITYTVQGQDSKTYTHTVKFQKSGEKTEDINLKRNNLYRIILSNDDSKIKVTLTVADWNKGEEFTVSNGELAQGLALPSKEYDDAAIGDILLKDGTLLDGSKLNQGLKLNEQQKKDAVGIVCLLNDKMQQDVKDKQWTHGLVLAFKAVKPYASGVQWGTDTKDYSTNLGYTRSQKYKSASAQTAIYTAMNWSDAPQVAGSGTKNSGWYLPCKDEWNDLLTAVCGASGKGGTYIDGLMEAAVGTGNYDSMLNSGSTSYWWSSSESNTNYCWSADVDTDSWSISNYSDYRPRTYGVRCVLAF